MKAGWRYGFRMIAPARSGRARPSSLRGGRRHGFTMIEVLTVLMIMSVVVRIGIPNYQEVRLRAEAARVVGDFEVVRVAVFNYNADHHTWPRDFGPGVVPPELRPYLPEGFTFDRGLYELDWENWILPDGLPKHPETKVLLGISVTTPDPALGHAVEDLLGTSMAHYTLGDNYTFVIEAL